MPYILSKMRPQLDKDILPLAHTLASPEVLDGEVNYVITKLLLETYGGHSYAIYNRMIGVLECVKLELYRRAVGPYEDRKAQQNGDVY